MRMRRDGHNENDVPPPRAAPATARLSGKYPAGRRSLPTAKCQDTAYHQWHFFKSANWGTFMRPIAAKVLLLASITAASLANAQDVKNLAGKEVRCAAAKSQPCTADSCANRCEISLKLPVGATYVSTHYFTTADYPNDRAGVWETGSKDVSYAHFSDAVHASNQYQEEVVTVYYFNRSNRDRNIAISVDYRTAPR